MFERRKFDISVDLSCISIFPPEPGAHSAYILFHIFGSVLECLLPNLKAHLRRRICHKVAIRAIRAVSLGTLLLIGVPIAALVLLLLLRHRRRW